MWLRAIIVLFCVVTFITGCSSLFSQLAGTNRLRVYSMEEVIRAGIGDADYIEVTDLVIPGDYGYVANTREEAPGFFIYPVLSPAQHEQLEAGNPVEIALLAWIKKPENGCRQAGNCIPAGASTQRGLVGKVKPKYDGTSQLTGKKYTLAKDVIYLEAGKTPLPWYWNVTMMGGALILAFLIEKRFHKKEKHGGT